MSSPAQKKALQIIATTGAAEGVNARTLNTMMRKSWIVRDETGLVLTKRGKRIAEGRAGGSLPEVKKAQLRAHLKQHRPAKKKRDRRTTAKEKAEHLEGLEAHIRGREKITAAAMARILGPSGQVRAVKIARADGGIFDKQAVKRFEDAGWKILAAGTVSARPGASGVPGVVFSEDDWTFRNPDALGPNGTARALILGGWVNRRTVESLSNEGYDVTPAPKKIREGATVRNPGSSIQKKVYTALVKAANKGQALNLEEVSEKTKAPLGAVETAIAALQAAGLAWIAGKDLFGKCYMPGQEPPRGLFTNPGKPSRAKAARIAMKKAEAFFWDDEELTEPMELKGYKPPTSGILIGEIVAIEYASRKDGTRKIYRHDVTKKRNLIVSVGGDTFIVDPPFKITKRGIEG